MSEGARGEGETGKETQRQQRADSNHSTDKNTLTHTHSRIYSYTCHKTCSMERDKYMWGWRESEEDIQGKLEKLLQSLWAAKLAECVSNLDVAIALKPNNI